MKLSSMEGYSSPYLKASDLNDSQVEVTIERVEIREMNKPKSDQKMKKAVLFFVGKTKGLVLNKTNAAILESKFGDVDNFSGKKIVLRPLPTTLGKDTISIAIPREEVSQEDLDSMARSL